MYTIFYQLYSFIFKLCLGEKPLEMYLFRSVTVWALLRMHETSPQQSKRGGDLNLNIRAFQGIFHPTKA